MSLLLVEAKFSATVDLLEGDHAAGGDVEAAADAVAVAAARASHAGEGQVQEDSGLVEGRGAGRADEGAAALAVAAVGSPHARKISSPLVVALLPFTVLATRVRTLVGS